MAAGEGFGLREKLECSCYMAPTLLFHQNQVIKLLKKQKHKLQLIGL